MKRALEYLVRDVFGGLGRDIRYAARIYRHRTMSASLAVLALASALGVTTGLFSVVNAVLFRSLPVTAPERLFELENFRLIERGLHNRPAFTRWAQQCPWWYETTAYRSPPVSLSGHDGRGVWVNATETTSQFFPVLGAGIALGRSFEADEDIPGKDTVAVISHAVWQDVFGSDRGVLGVTVRLNNIPFTVVGVAAPGFDFPNKSAVWVPTYFDPYYVPKSDGFMGNSIGRLRDDLSFDAASTMARVQLGRAFPREMAEEPQYRLRLVSLRDRLTGPVRRANLILLAAVVCVLLIACVDVAQLVLYRTAERRQEFAVRAALGAGRLRAIRQLITETTTLIPT